MLEAVKVSPDNGGACCKVAVTANLDSSRARWRERSQVRDEETNLQIKQRSLRRKKDAPPCLNFLTRKAPYKGLGADSEEKHEPVGDIDTVVVDSLKALDLERPIRVADIPQVRYEGPQGFDGTRTSCCSYPRAPMLGDPQVCRTAFFLAACGLGPARRVVPR